MTPKQFKQARSDLGLSQRRLSAALNLPRANGDRTIRRWEAGERDIPGPVVKLMCLFTENPDRMLEWEPN